MRCSLLLLTLAVAVGAPAAAAGGPLATGGTPPAHLGRELLVRLGEGRTPDALGLPRERLRRAVPAELAVARFLRAQPPRRTRRGEVVIGGRAYRSLADVPERVLLDAAYAALPARARGLYRTWTLTLEPGADPDAVARTLAADPEVEYAEPNYLYTTDLIPTDPRYPEQWAHPITAAEAGWDVETGDPNVVIAVVDTGVDYDHEDLAANVWRDGAGNPGRDTVDLDTKLYKDAGFTLLDGEDYREEDDDPFDRHAHGTHVAGIAAAVAQNGVGVAGVCHGCRIMPVRAGSAIGFDGDVFGSLESDDVARGIVWAADNGADVINMSFGSFKASQLIRDALDYARDVQGVVLVAAAGNAGGVTERFPAAFESVIAVAATQIGDERVFYSSHGLWVDVAAPGGGGGPFILSTVPPDAFVGDPSGYRGFQGTSMASPYAAGLAGLVLSRFSGFDPEGIRQLLRSTADPANTEDFIGYGRVNVSRALTVGGPTSAVAAITSPEPNEALFGGVIDVAGTATGTSYLLEIADAPYADTWTTIAAGTAIADGVLGTFDSSVLTGNTTHYLRLTATDTFGLVDLVPVYAGWRQILPGARLSSATTVDVDGDGRKEIVVATHGTSGTGGLNADAESAQIHVWRDDGTPLAGFPVDAPGTEWPHRTTPAIGDLDADGDVEIVHAGEAGLLVFNHDGSPFAPWPGPASTGGTRRSPVLADLDGDGDLEIIAPVYRIDFFEVDETLWAWHHDGVPVDGFPVSVEEIAGVEIPDGSFEYTSDAAVVDLDRDGVPEIVVIIWECRLPLDLAVVLRADGTVAPGWPRQPSPDLLGPCGATTVPPFVGDVDADGDMEIFALLGRWHTHAWEHDGTLLSGWPLGLRGSTSPALGDLDGDGDLEIVFSDVSTVIEPHKGTMTVVHHDGTLATGWPQLVEPSFFPQPTAIVADLDGDGALEVVSRSRDRLHAWHGDGSPVSGFPLRAPSPDRVTEQFAVEPLAAVDDLDGDGTPEIVATMNAADVYLFGLPTAFAPSPRGWPTYRHDPQNTGVLPSTCGDGVVDPGEACDDAGESATCNRNCRVAACGDGVHNTTAGEDCDGTDGAAPGCCIADCRFAPTGTACDDVEACTQDDVCDRGVCAGTVAPAASCREPARPRGGALKIMDRAESKRDSLTWKVAAAGTSVGDFGDPVLDTDYRLCVYDEAGSPTRLVMERTIPAGGTCGAKPCWKATKSTGFSYKGPKDGDLGIRVLKLKARSNGQGRIKLKGKGAALDPPDPPLAPRVTVQLHNERDGVCWTTAFETSVTRNDDERFKARSE